LIFGRAAPALAADFGWTEERAQRFIDNYFTVFSGVRRQIEAFRSFILEHGYITNLLGRRRRLPESQSPQQGIRERALRQGVNFPIQSLLHDLMLYCAAMVLEEFKRYDLRSVMCGEAHDSIILD